MKKLFLITTVLVLVAGIIGCTNVSSYGDKETKPKAIQPMSLKQENSRVSKAVSPSEKGKLPLSNGNTLKEQSKVVSEDLAPLDSKGRSTKLEDKKSDSKSTNGFFTLVNPSNPAVPEKSSFFADLLKYYAVLFLLLLLSYLGYWLWKMKTIKNPFKTPAAKEETSTVTVSPAKVETEKQLELNI